MRTCWSSDSGAYSPQISGGSGAWDAGVPRNIGSYDGVYSIINSYIKGPNSMAHRGPIEEVVRVRGVFSSGGLGAWASEVLRNKGSHYEVGVYLIPISGGQVAWLQGCLKNRRLGSGAYSPQISGNQRTWATRVGEHRGNKVQGPQGYPEHGGTRRPVQSSLCIQ